MKIFFDDVRSPEQVYNKNDLSYDAPLITYTSGEWLIIRDYFTFVHVITNNLSAITEISLDHDMGSINGKENLSGYDAILWLTDFCRDTKSNLPTIYVHSLNPVGAKRIRDVVNDFLYG
jgi:hypothetical protein